MSFLLGILPIKWLAGLLGGGALLGGLFIKGKVASVEAQSEKVEDAKKVVENHAAEQKLTAAKTPEDMYAALEADRASDSH